MWGPVLGLILQPGHVSGVLLQGCVGLVTADALDVLSHAAVRARNCSVLLATCSDAAALQGLRALAGRSIELSVSQVGMLNPPGACQPSCHAADANMR